MLHRLVCFEVIFGFGRFLRKNIELVKFIFGFFSKTLQFICNILCNVDGLKKVYRFFFCLTLHKTTLYPKTFFETKRARQNSLCLIVDSNCRARDEVSLTGHAKISAKASTAVNCKFEKVLTLSCRSTHLVAQI